jgi:DNA replication protein DnaC
MGAMTSKRKPKAIDVGDWRSRIPASILAEAEAEGPLDLSSSHDETPEQARERVRLARESLNRAYTERAPLLYRDARLSDLDNDTALAINEWLMKGGSTLMLAGPVGTGKTHAGYATVHHLMAEGMTVEATTLADLLANLRPDGDASAARRARVAQALLLDDFGAAKASEWAVEQIVALLDARLRDGLVQVVTTNSPYDALLEAWDARAMDRLRYRWSVIQMIGESRRKAAW